MFEKEIETVKSITLPDEVMKDVLDCIDAKIAYLKDETPDNLIEVKYSFDLAFTDIKALKSCHMISQADFDTIHVIIRKIDE